jgi:hypothetical protein
MTAIRSVLLAGLVCAAAFGQAAPAHPQFEVASIRPSGPMPESRLSIGLHIDGAQARYTFLTVKDYVRMAYRVKDYQIETPE